MTIKTVRKLTKGDTEDPVHSVGLSTDGGEDDIARFVDFVHAVRGGAVPDQTGKFYAFPATSSAEAKMLAEFVQKASAAGKVQILTDVLSRAASDRELFESLLAAADRDPALFANAAAAPNLATYRKAVAELKLLVETRDVKEEKFQALLPKNPWMFGSEYSELLPRRKWTRDGQKDFVVRRTTGGYIELIEIKTPLNGAALFLLDKSHDSPFAGTDLSKVVGQVAKYLEMLDAERYDILAKGHEDTNKNCANVVIGRDNSERQVQALRRFNSHLARVEIITSDQLVRIAERVLNYLERAVKPQNPEGLDRPARDSSENNGHFEKKRMRR